MTHPRGEASMTNETGKLLPTDASSRLDGSTDRAKSSSSSEAKAQVASDKISCRAVQATR